MDGRASAVSLGDQVYQELRKKVLSRQLRPGDPVRELELSENFSVSRTPVREALKRLETDGWLTYLPNGAVISTLGPDQAAELYATREILEGSSAGMAAERALDYEIELLRGVLQQQKEVKDDVEELTRLNRSFHNMIFRMAHNRYLFDMVCKAQDYMVLLQNINPYTFPGRARSAYTEHLAIVDAIAKRDADAAAAAHRRHSREALKIRMRLEFGK